MNKKKANWISHILLRNCLLKYITEGKTCGIDMTGRPGRRRKQLLNYGKKTRGYRKYKEKALHRTLWRTLFGRGYKSVVKTDYAFSDE